MSNLSAHITPPPLLRLPTELREQIVSCLDKVQDKFSTEQVLWQDSRDAQGAWIGNPSMWNAAFARALDRPQQLRDVPLIVGKTSALANRHVLSCGLDWDCLMRLHSQTNISRRAHAVCEALAPKSPVTLQFQSIVADSHLAKAYGRSRRDSDGVLTRVVLRHNIYVAPDYRLFQNPLVQPTFLTQQSDRCPADGPECGASRMRGFGLLHPYDRGHQKVLYPR